MLRTQLSSAPVLDGLKGRLAMLVGVGLLLSPGLASATIPYGSVTPGTPGIGPAIAPPSSVPGKEYSHDLDHEITAAGTSLLPEQVVAWDGSGGVANGVNYIGERVTYTTRSQIDAIANQNDALFRPLLEDRSHLIWSFDAHFNTIVAGGGVFPSTHPSVGPVPLPSGKMVGGAAELNYELGTLGGLNPPDTQGIWAKAPEINGMPGTDTPLRDIDGVEVWGPEPGFTGDANKYSIDIDALTFGAGPGGDAVSVWNSPSGTAYIDHSTIVSAVVTLLGPLSGFLPHDDMQIDGPESVNLDALMVREVAGEEDSFGRDPTGGGDHDQIIFSIRQIVDPTGSTGYYATGSELFVLDGAGGVGFLKHGGHLWDDTYALGAFGGDTPNGRFVLDVNAIEAVAESVVPEPSAALVLVSFGMIGLSVRRRSN